MNAVYAIHAAATWAMVGFAWTIQLLQYPLMAHVPPAGFVDFERQHQRRVSMVLALFAPVELVTAAWIVVIEPANPIGWVAGAVLAGIWIATGFYFAPVHARLSTGFDAGLHQSLVRWNWARTAGWTIRAVLATMLLLG